MRGRRSDLLGNALAERVAVLLGGVIAEVSSASLPPATMIILSLSTCAAVAVHALGAVEHLEEERGLLLLRRLGLAIHRGRELVERDAVDGAGADLDVGLDAQAAGAVRAMNSFWTESICFWANVSLAGSPLTTLTI